MLTKQSFSGHVNELRLRLLVWFIFFIIGSVIGYSKSNFFLSLLTRPLEEPLFYTSPAGGFIFVMQAAIIFGFLVSLPILIYEIIKFCQPVFSENVKKVVPKLVIFSFCLLILSIVIAFYLFIPAAIHFLKGFGNGQIQALITTNEYFSFIMIYLIGLGILFQMPIIILLINYIHCLSVKRMMGWQKIIIASSFIVAAILTPTPDPINQTLMAAPIIILYQLSILLIWIVNKNLKPSEDLGMVAKSPKKRITYYAILLFVIALVMLLISTSVWRGHLQNQKIASQIDTIDRKITQAIDLVDTDPDQARNILASINSLINGLNSSSEQIINLKEQYKNLISKINQIVYISQDNVTNVSSDTAKFVVVGRYLITARQNSSDLFQQTLNEEDEVKVIHSFPEGSGISNLYADETNNRILLTTTDNRIFDISFKDDDADVTEIQPPVGESWPDIKSLTTFLNNIYLLERETGMIWKYASSDGIVYSSRSPYLVSADLGNKDAKAIAADGSIYLLFNNGKVSKFLRGTSDKFASPELPIPNNEWQSPEAIFSSAGSNNIYIQDKNRIVEITKLGEYQRQFVLADKQIRATYISIRIKTGWVLSGDKIYQFSFK